MTRIGKLYITAIALTGIGIIVWAATSAAAWQNIPLLIGLMGLISVSQIVSQVVTTIGSSARITFSVSHAILLATAALISPEAAVIAAIVDGLGIWVSGIAYDRQNWKDSFETLVFNMGMVVISTFVASQSFVALSGLISAETLTSQILIWGISAIIFDQVNIWLLAFVIAIQYNISPVKFWKDQRWAMPINILATSVGGILVTAGVEAVGLRGLVLLTLPLLLFAYIFRLYITNSERQIEALENANTALAETNAKLEAVSQAKRRLLAMLSHDMRTPLNTIKLYSALLIDHPEITEAKRKRILQSILASEESVVSMVNNIVELEQIRSGQPIDMDCIAVNLVSLVRPAITSVEAHANHKQIALNLHDQAEPIFVKADVKKMIRVFQNLLSNAIKYSPKGSSLIGGIIGIILGASAAFALSNFLGDLVPTVDLGTVVMATSFATAVGVIFGLYPAWRASNLRPIEALRYE